MADLPRFSLPPLTAEQVSGVPFERELSEAKAQSWHTEVDRNFGLVLSPGDPTLYNPTDDEIPDDAAKAEPKWEAFPARLQKMNLSDDARWHRADTNRLEQDEYCEWSVLKDPATDKIMRVTFTCELPEYFENHLAKDKELLVALYQKYVDKRVEPKQLGLPNYQRDNVWNNSSTDGNIMHLMQGNNNLFAAVALVGAATIVRKEADGTQITERSRLFECSDGALGDPKRNSDPQIAERINQVAREKKRVTLADPVGLFIHELIDAGIEFPDGLTLDDCWHIERGDPGHTLRAKFELPEGQSVEDVEIEGRPITFGAQIADRVMVRITALADRTGTQEPISKQCGE